MTDISIEDVKKNTSLNIYEAVVIMSKRARQINDEQKAEILSETPQLGALERENEDFDEVEIDREALEREYKKYPKPTTLALGELLTKDIKYKLAHEIIEEETAGPEPELPEEKPRKSGKKSKKA